MGKVGSKSVILCDVVIGCLVSEITGGSPIYRSPNLSLIHFSNNAFNFFPHKETVGEERNF